MSGLIHVEKHFNASKRVRNIVIGISDRLTGPFALAVGLTGAIAASSLVITAGLMKLQSVLLQWGLEVI